MNCFKTYTLILIPPFLTQCKKSNKACIIREWKVIDLYRNNYPSFKDTACHDSILLVNGIKVGPSFPDTAFNHTGSNRSFSLDATGTCVIDTTATISANDSKYEAARVTYLHKGYNIDQAFFLHVVKDKWIYIQQESHDKNLFLLKSIQKGQTTTENTEPIADAMLKDTILFPLPPR